MPTRIFSGELRSSITYSLRNISYLCLPATLKADRQHLFDKSKTKKFRFEDNIEQSSKFQSNTDHRHKIKTIM